jgi:DNA-binding NarL/FixJ family response regulator
MTVHLTVLLLKLYLGGEFSLQLDILFIEDDEILKNNLIKNYDKSEISGYYINAHGTSSFEKGIKLIENRDFDIVILDLFKDGNEKDENAGLEVLNKIRKIIFIPVIFYTGYAHKINYLISEIVGVVSKGDGIEYLNNAIQNIINSKIALIKKSINNHIKESLRLYFWETVDTDKRIFIPNKNDFSLGYLLLRRIANSLSKENIKDLLGDDKIRIGKAHPMEFYIYPIKEKDEYQAGEILFKDKTFYVILTPSCDFIEDKENKRERKVGFVLLTRATSLKDTEYYKKFKKNPKDNKDGLLRLIESRKGDRFFFLPSTPFIENLVLDFQNKIIINYDELKSFSRIAKLDDPYAQSVLSSFIRYYNRIGFPDLDSEYIINNIEC